MKTCGEYETLISAFLDGELSEEERAEAAEHLASCPACQRYFDDLVAIHDAFDQAEEAPVPEGFAARVMAQVRETPQAETRKIIPFPSWKRWTALAACCAIVALGLWSVRHKGVESVSQTVLAHSAPSMARDADAPADGGSIANDDAPMALMMDGEDEALAEEYAAPLPSEDPSEAQKYHRDAASGGASGSLPETEDAIVEDGGYFESDALAPEPALALPAPAANGQAGPLSGVIAASGGTVRTWVEAELGLEWEPGRTYLLTEEEYAGLLDALTAAGEDFRLEPGEGCWLLAE